MKDKTKFILILCVLGMLFFYTEKCSAEEMKIETVSTGDVNDVIPEEIDLGNYQTEMVVGEKQLLDVTILPENACVQGITYSSSNTQVAIINGMGRITAVGSGETVITVACGEVLSNFTLNVREENGQIAVTELDLGDCPRQITVGASQILNIAVIPANATETNFIYKSDNEAIATVNELGRLTGHAIGSVEITVICGNVEKTFKVSVVEDTSNVAVKDIEIQDYEEELNVGSTMTISAMVLPTNATDTNITYSSSNPEIATVNSFGQVKGVSPGMVTIAVCAGSVVKYVSLIVIVETNAIQLNSNYEILKPGEKFQIKATVLPQGTEENIKYKSIDASIASVSEDGIVTANRCGGTAVIVSNGNFQVSMSVIVNENGTVESIDKTNNVDNVLNTIQFPDEVNVDDCPIVSTEMLKYFYEKGKVLTVKGENYTLFINGKNIVNFENELKTMLVFRQENDGISFTVNDGNKLCSDIVIDISEIVTNEKYLYLYNDNEQKYERIEIEDLSLLCIDAGGTYLLTNSKLSGLEINTALIIVGGLMLVIGAAIYIGVKKQYWFW